MSKTHFIRSNVKDIKLPETLTFEQIKEIVVKKNTIEAYLFGINSIEEWKKNIKSEKITHYWCYDKNSNKVECTPLLPIPKETLYRLELALDGVF
jgi:hypothetical protein